MRCSRALCYVGEIGRNEGGRREHTNAPSPSMMASLSFAIEKPPSTLTAVTFGRVGTEKYCPGGKAW